jgi:hypothetical protein
MLVMFFFKKERKKNVPSLEMQRLEVLLLLLLPFCVGGGECCYRRTVPVWLYRRANVATPCAMVVVVVIVHVVSSVKRMLEV